MTVDIQKMYRNINKADREYKSILWRENPNDVISEYVPYLAIRTLQQLARDNSDIYPTALTTLRDFYVNDLMSGNGSFESERKSIEQIHFLMEVNGFRLQKWARNGPNVLANVSRDLRKLRNTRSKLWGFIGTE